MEARAAERPEIRSHAEHGNEEGVASLGTGCNAFGVVSHNGKPSHTHSPLQLSSNAELIIAKSRTMERSTKMRKATGFSFAFSNPPDFFSNSFSGVFATYPSIKLLDECS